MATFHWSGTEGRTGPGQHLRPQSQNIQAHISSSLRDAAGYTMSFRSGNETTVAAQRKDKMRHKVDRVWGKSFVFPAISKKADVEGEERRSSRRHDRTPRYPNRADAMRDKDGGRTCAPLPLFGRLVFKWHSRQTVRRIVLNGQEQEVPSRGRTDEKY
ncbi:unnamed protein product [Lota lota]